MTGFDSTGVLEVVKAPQGDTYLAFYTFKFAGCVYVLLLSRWSPKAASRRRNWTWI